MRPFAELQSGLAAVMRANVPGSSVPHVVVALPSHSLPPTVASHYGDRLLSLEHRYLVSSLLTHRIRTAHWVQVSSLPSDPAVMTYYRDLGPHPTSFEARTRLLALDDRSQRSAAAKLLDRPDVLEAVRRYVDGRPAVIEPWNVTEHEVAVAEALGIPVNGTDPALLPLAAKSAGRRLFVRRVSRSPWGSRTSGPWPRSGLPSP